MAARQDEDRERAAGLVVEDKRTIRLTIDMEFQGKGFDPSGAESAVFEMGEEFMEELQFVGDEEYEVKEYQVTSQILSVAKAEARGVFADSPVTVRALLDVSTAHMNESAGFGNHRVERLEYGAILFLSEDFSADPDWLKPILVEARKVSAIAVNFDRDAKMVEGWTDFSEEVA